MAKVSFRNVWKKYGDMPAVKDLNIESCVISRTFKHIEEILSNT